MIYKWINVIATKILILFIFISLFEEQYYEETFMNNKIILSLIYIMVIFFGIIALIKSNYLFYKTWSIRIFEIDNPSNVK